MKLHYETFVAAPFGNYIKPKDCIPVTGSFTLHPQGNRLWRVIKTLRYSWKLNGWVNALGLPNPGIKVGVRAKLKKITPKELEKEVNMSGGIDFKKLYKR